MLYGLYLSAGGVMANSRRQDVIANNLANVETVGFRRDSATFAQRLTAVQEQRQSPGKASDLLLEGLGGGLKMLPNQIDLSQGSLESSSNPFDLAIEGKGFFGVRDGGQTRLTRDGRFLLNKDGYLVRAGGDGERVLDVKGQPIHLEGTDGLTISDDGKIALHGELAGQIGLFDVSDRTKLTKVGSTMLGYDASVKLMPAAGKVRSQFVERSNVDPATELAALMETSRQLEANANMIRFQDQSLGRLVNEVGKVG